MSPEKESDFSPKRESGATPGLKRLPFASMEDFKALDLAALLAEQPRADGYALEQVLGDAAKAYPDENSGPARALGVLLALCSFHLLLEPEGDAFGPRWTAPNGTRTIIPSDLRGAQSAVLAAVAAELPHPFLRARAAEVAYENGDRRMGPTAIDAYAELVLQRLDGTFASELGEDRASATDVVAPIERAFQINALVSKRGTVAGSLKQAHALAYARAISEPAYFEFQTLAVIGINNKLLEPTDVAKTATALAEAAPEDAYCLAVKEVWLVAADANERAGNKEASRAASLKAIDQTLRMQNQVGMHAARAHWIKVSIGELRQLGGCQERVEELRKQLREAQERSLEEFGQINTPINLADIRAATIEEFARFDLPEAMRQVIHILIPPAVDVLKQETLDIARRTPLSSIFASSYADFEGKEVARGPMLGLDGEPSEEWFKEQSFRHQAPARHIAMFGQIEPARRAIMSSFPVPERHFVPVATFSAFVPPSHRHIFAMGFARLWQGDYVTAGHLLIPQLENSLRHVLTLAGVDSTKIEDDGIQGDRALSMLMTVAREQLTEIFGEDVVWQIDTLYNFRPGPAIRHELAHGKIGWGAFYTPDVMLACWFVYYLTVLPLLDSWEEEVVPYVRGML